MDKCVDYIANTENYGGKMKRNECDKLTKRT
jgi:hypothetical protein